MKLFFLPTADLFIALSRLKRIYKILFRAKKRAGNKTQTVEIFTG